MSVKGPLRGAGMVQKDMPQVFNEKSVGENMVFFVTIQTLFCHR
jgi:hypothetical protein